MSLLDRTVASAKRVAAAVAGLLPAPPSGQAPPPDIDGRRRDDVDPEDLRRVQRARKEGRGWFR